MSLEAQSTNFASWVCSYIGLGLLRLSLLLDIVVFCNSAFLQLDRSNFEKRKCFMYDSIYTKSVRRDIKPKPSCPGVHPTHAQQCHTRIVPNEWYA
jgi:hypothetical protein